jgi:chromosome segregation ATPase
MRAWGWFQIIQRTRPLIGAPNPEEELRLLEEKSKGTYGAYADAIQVTKDLEGSMDGLKAEIGALTKQLEAEQGNISQYQVRQAKANGMMAETETELAAQQAVLASAENTRIELTEEVKKYGGSIGVVKKDIEDLEISIQKIEAEKGARDHVIHSLNDEIASQDEVINKLNKEKKHIADTQAKSSEDLTSADEKVGHLSSIKKKLESTLDELEGSLDKEKRTRAQVEKQRRTVEGELKVAQDTVGDLERSKKELEGLIGRKEKDSLGLAAKLDDEQSNVAKAQKNIKECQGRVEELEEELEAERQARAKAERQRADHAREIEQLGERLDEAGGATGAQIELNKKREAEVNKLRKDLEEANIQQESILR